MSESIDNLIEHVFLTRKIKRENLDSREQAYHLARGLGVTAS